MTLLDRPEMRQIAQRITGRYHLQPLSKEDTAAYVRHRMGVAGAQSRVFTAAAVRRLYRRSRGIPRLINVIADRALLAAYTEDRRMVDGRLVSRAATEVFGTRRPAGGPRWPWAAAAVGVASFVLATSNLWQLRGQASHEKVPPVDPPSGSADLPTAVAGATIASAAEEPPAAAAPTVPQLLQTSDFQMTRAQALGSLLTLWGGHYDAAGDEPCAQAEQQGLRCFFQQSGSLSELRRVNWPAVLALVDEHGAEHPVLIGSLGYDDAQVVANGKTFTLPLAELTFYWYGDHWLLWRPGFLPPKVLVPGAQDDGVVWLRATLARLRGEVAPTDPSPVYDAALERRVRSYQRERLLDVDGIVGARTQIAMLAELALPDTPLLLAGH